MFVLNASVTILILGGADRINKVQITNRSLDTVTISWEPPEDPNGIIFTISVEYKRVDIDNVRIHSFRN